MKKITLIAFLLIGYLANAQHIRVGQLSEPTGQPAGKAIVTTGTGGYQLGDVATATPTALGVINVPSGTITSTNVQGALNGLDAIKEPTLTKGSLTESVVGLEFSNTRQVIGGSTTLSVTSGYVIPTTTEQANWTTAYTDRLKWDGGSTGLTAATGRTSLGGTTVGQSMFTLINPSAITFPRINADNTVSALSASDFRTAIGAGSGSATGEIWTALTGSYASATTFTIIGTNKDVGLLELSLLTCTNSTGATRKIGYIKTATNSSGTITCNVITDSNLASGDKDFKVAYNRKVTDYMRLVTIPGEQIADASFSQGMFYADIQTASYLLPVDASVLTAASGTGAALTFNVYSGASALFSSAPDLSTNTVLRSQRPTTNTIAAAANVSIRILSSAGATNKAADFQAKLYIVPQSIFTAF